MRMILKIWILVFLPMESAFSLNFTPKENPEFEIAMGIFQDLGGRRGVASVGNFKPKITWAIENNMFIPLYKGLKTPGKFAKELIRIDRKVPVLQCVGPFTPFNYEELVIEWKIENISNNKRCPKKLSFRKGLGLKDSVLGWSEPQCLYRGGAVLLPIDGQFPGWRDTFEKKYSKSAKKKYFYNDRLVIFLTRAGEFLPKWAK